MKTSIVAIVIILVILAGAYFVIMQKKPDNFVPMNTNSVLTQVTGKTVEFVMTAKQFAYSPSEIKVRQGDRVRIRITSSDVTHGFAIAEYSINSKLEPNKETVIDFVADKKGVFTFYCNIPCGEGHRDMKGILIVE